MHRLVALAIAIVLTGPSAGNEPNALSSVTAGLWEISGTPGSQHPIRQCIAEMLMLAQFEHRTRICTRSIVSDHANRTVVNYSCGPSDFGQSQIDVITPRSLRISTQGISDLLPFNYVLQARRIGDCTASINRH